MDARALESGGNPTVASCRNPWELLTKPRVPVA